jgi:hypothetical protein
MEAAMKTTALKLLVLALALTGMTWAAEDDEPGRGVARISLMNGDVSVRRGDSGDWVAAAVNAALSAEDTVVTGANSRAEVQLDYSNLIRMSANAEVKLADLENQRYTVQVARGLVTFRVLRDSDADVEISTPNVSVRPAGIGTYRIEVRENGDSEITVRSGNADIFTPRGSQQLQAGRTMLARGTAADPEFRIVSAIGRDEWDRWNENRDGYFTRSTSYQYVDSSIYGAEDLDAYGDWSYAAPYGYVWSPRVAAGWAPYSYGQWSWMDYYGWNWVSYDPWGWAPFHYGRWFNNGPRGWCWYPGAMHSRQYWRPGLVAFFGYGGRGGGVGFGFGNIGWVPLAPYETYRPWYGRGMYGGYRNTTIIDNSVHIVNNTNIVNSYRNARIANAVSGVDASQFGRRNANLIRVSDGQMRTADLVQGRMPVVPNRDSLRLSTREINPGQAPRTIAANERFVSRRQPSQVDRVPFDQQQKAIEQVTRRTFNQPSTVQRTDQGAAPAVANGPRNGQGTAPRSFTPADSGNAGVRTQTAPQDRATTDGWRRFGGTTPNDQPRTAPNTAPSVRTAPDQSSAPSNQSNGWRRFEGPSGNTAPQQGSVRDTPRNSAPPSQPSVDRNSGSGQIRISPPIVRQRESAPPPQAPRASESPRYSAPPPREAQPAPRASEPRYSAPPARQAPAVQRYSAPARQAPSGGGGSSRTSQAPSRSRSR